MKSFGAYSQGKESRIQSPDLSLRCHTGNSLAALRNKLDKSQTRLPATSFKPVCFLNVDLKASTVTSSPGKLDYIKKEYQSENLHYLLVNLKKK